MKFDTLSPLRRVGSGIYKPFLGFDGLVGIGLICFAMIFFSLNNK